MKKFLGRRSFLGSAAGLAGAGFWADQSIEAYQGNVQTASKPSELRITDVRMAFINIGGGLIRLDTNQGIYGIGENRDGASRNYVMELKRLVVGENPCNVDRIFRKIKQFGYHARQGGGVCGMEMALWDLAGKAYNVPVYQMLGGKFRDRVRIYCDTPESDDPKVFAQRVKIRKEEGFTWFKADVGVPMLANIPGTMSYPSGADIGIFMRPPGQQPGAAPGQGGPGGVGGGRGGFPQGPRNLPVEHMFTGLELTDKGIGIMSDYLAKVREAIGYDVPLSTDHFGHFGINSAIRLGKAFEKFNLAWMEDIIPWENAELLKKITDSIEVPTCTGEDIYLKEGFINLAKNHAVDILHPDIATSGGILETHKIGDAIQEYGVPMAMHMANCPVSAYASVHVAAATENFLVLENHSVDNPNWDTIVDGVEKPIINKGYIPVPGGPGLGFKLNEEACKKLLREPGYFEPTPQWDNTARVNDRLWSRSAPAGSIWRSV
jgi:L-alanine-DL-glutamate epimerase-like enolase superfamily enzyme